MRKTLGTVLLGIFVLASFGSTASAGARGCKPMRPSISSSQSGQHAEAQDAPVDVISDRATRRRPLVVEYEHGAGLDPGYGYDVIVPDATFFNFQVHSAKQFRTINFRAEWPGPSAQDVELILYDDRGNEVAYSASFNAVPEVNNDDDGNGWEQILGIGARNCAGFTLESQGGITAGTPMTLKVWLE